jgi:hypothetical protein
MTADTLKNELEEIIPRLFEIAKELTWNTLSNNCKFILSEIKNNEGNFHDQQLKRIIENDRKNPGTLQELMPTLQKLYDNFYDINLHIYKSTKTLTIIDICYYLKSSLDEDYRPKVINNSPMLHCKVSLPPGHSDKEGKFDINWEHKKR